MLVGGEYQPLPGRELADRTLALWSEVLGLELRRADRRLRFHDPQTGEDLPDLAETADQRQQEAAARQAAETRAHQEAAARQAAETRARQEAAARQAAEARLAALEASLRRRPDAGNK